MNFKFHNSTFSGLGIFLRKFGFVFAFGFFTHMAEALELNANDQWMDSILSPANLDDGWPVGNVEEAGLDLKLIQKLTNALDRQEFNQIQSVLVEHQGRLIYEYYDSISPDGIKDSFKRDSKHALYSVTKSVTSLLLGIALEGNFEQALDKPITEFLTDRDLSQIDTASKITLKQVLTMTAGYHWNEMDLSYYESSNDDNAMHASLDPVGFVLSRPLREPPGERWYYNGGMSMVMAEIIDQATEQSFVGYANQTLLQPLGIIDYHWAGKWSGNTLANAGWGLHLTARDLARIGSLVLHRGDWQGKQIVSPDWIALSSQRLREDVGDWSVDGTFGYGLHWWQGRFDANGNSFDAITASGWGGQRVFVVPSRNLSVTVFASNFTGDWLMPEMILARIVAAVRSP